MWLHGLGHDVTGVELSPIAVRKFFKASRLHPKRSHRQELTCWSHDRLTIYCGDFFQLMRCASGATPSFRTIASCCC